MRFLAQKKKQLALAISGDTRWRHWPQKLGDDGMVQNWADRIQGLSSPLNDDAAGPDGGASPAAGAVFHATYRTIKQVTPVFLPDLPHIRH